MASIQCGNCHRTHNSVAEVKACYGGAVQDVAVAVANERGRATPMVDDWGEAKTILKQGARVEPGYYQLGEDIYKVQMNREETRAYAKILVVDSSEDGTNKGRFEYAPGAISKLSPEMALGEEAASEFGQLYGFCCICGLKLTNEESIERGIGPICRAKMGWA